MTTLPDSLRYILWRYGYDHSGEDHQARLKDAQAWLSQVAPVPPMKVINLIRTALYATIQAYPHADQTLVNDLIAAWDALEPLADLARQKEENQP